MQNPIRAKSLTTLEWNGQRGKGQGVVHRLLGGDPWRIFGYLLVFLAENPRDLGGIIYYCLLGGAGAFFCVPQTPLFWVFTVFLAVFAPGVLQTKCGFPIFGRSTIRSFLFLGDRLRLGTSINTELNY